MPCKFLLHFSCKEIETQEGQAHYMSLCKAQFSSVLSYVRLFATPWTAAFQASLSITSSQSLLKLMSIVSVMPSNHLNLCRPLLLLPSIFPSIRVFFNESFRHIRWPKHWSFSFSISPPNEYSILIFFRIDWFVQSWEGPDHPTWSSAHAPCSIHQLAGLCLSHSIYHTYRHLLSGLLAILVLSTCCLLDVLWW